MNGAHAPPTEHDVGLAADHFEAVIRRLGHALAAFGHSFGELLAQLLFVRRYV